MFIINRCFKNIWLESQMIHVALFSFQRTTLSFQNRLFFVPYDIYYFIAARSVCQEIFKISFLSELETLRFQMLASQGFSSVRSRVSRSDLYYITRFAPACQPFFEKMIKEDEQLWDEQLLVFFGKESFILERNGGSGIHFTSCREALGDIGFPYRQLHYNRTI